MLTDVCAVTAMSNASHGFTVEGFYSCFKAGFLEPCAIYMLQPAEKAHFIHMEWCTLCGVACIYMTGRQHL